MNKPSSDTSTACPSANSTSVFEAEKLASNAGAVNGTE
jgi:hypothetical protein